jgi:WD40 repeat protein
MFRFSGEHVMHTPNVSSPSNSPLADDLETYQAQASYQQSQLTTGATQSVSTPSSSTNQLLEPSQYTTPKGKLLSHSTGVSMVASPTSESPTRTSIPARTSLGPIPTTAAPPPIPSSHQSASAMATTSVATTTAASQSSSHQNSSYRSHHSSSGSPKDRSEKEKEKTSFRREFMKIFGSISDVVSSDKKSGEKSGERRDKDQSHHTSSSASPYGSHASITTSPGGALPPPVSYSDSHGKQDARKGHHAASKTGLQGTNNDPSSPSNSFNMLSASSNTIPHSTASYSSGAGIVSGQADIGLHDSTNLEDPANSLRLMGSIPSDIDSPLLSTTSSASVPQIARAHGPPTKMVTTYVEDLSSGEYQSRFLMQASLLEPIFTAPFADFELLAQNQDDERDQFEEFEQFKQLKQVRFDRAKCADLFSAGCIIYQLLSGTPLFHKDNIIQYLQGDGTWWWGSASQSIPRRFKALVFELVLAGRPYFLYALQTGVSLGYISRAMSGSQSTEQDSMETEDNPFDFGVASTLAPSIMTPTAFSGSLPNAQPQSINITDLGRLSEGVLAKFLNDDLISAPTSMKVFPSYFESVYQFLARYHGTQSRKKRVKLALENIGFLVNLPMSGLELILPDLISFFDHPDTAIDALSLIEPLAIKLGRNLTISKLLGPILSLYERIQQYQQQTTQSANASSKGTNTGPHIENFAASRLLELALELLAPRFVHTLLAKLGQNCFLKNIVSFLVNEIRSSRKEIGFAAGSAILRLVSVLSPPIYIRYILYPLLGQLNKANPEVLNAVLVEIGARMGEDVIVRHHMEVIVPLLQIHIFNKDSISVRTSTSLLKLIASLVELIHPTKIVSSLMVDHRCLFAILLTPPMHDKGLWEALLDCLSAVFSSMGLHLAIKYARPYVQQFFTLFGMPSSSALPLPSSGSNHSSFTSTSGNGESTTATSTTTITMASSQTSTNQEFDPKTLYPIMVMARFKDLLDVRSGGGNVSIQHTLGAAMRIESYLMGPVAAAPVPPTIVHGPEEGDSSVSAGLPANTTLLANASATGNGGSNSGTHAPLARHAPLEKSPSQVSIGELGTIESISKNLQVPGDNSSEVAVGSTLIAPRRLSSPVRPTSPTLSALATPPVVAETPKEKEAPPTPVLRLATANEDGHVADHMPMWLASMYGMPYIPAAATGSDSRGTSSSSSSRPTSTILAPGVVALGGTGSSGSGLANPGGGALGAQPTMGIATEKTATGPKKAMALLGATGTSSTSLNAGASPWDVSRDYEPSSAPIALHSFGPAMGHGSSNSNANSSNPNAGGGWPPSLGPNQTWNFSGQVGHSFKEHSNAIRCVHVHDNERLFLTGSKDTTVKCWDMLSEGASRQTYTGHRFAVTHAEFVDRGNLVASCDGSVHVWELERGNKLANMEAASVSAYASNSSRDRESPSAVFTCFTSHQDGRVVVCGTSLSTVTFTDLRAEQEVVCEWYLPTNAATSSSSVSQGPASGPGGSSGTTTGASPSTYPRSISLGHLDQNLMVVGQSSGHVTLIDIRSGILLHNWRAHDAPIISLKSVPDAPGFLVSASLDKTIALWDISNANTASPSILTHFKGHSDPLISFDIFKGTLYSISGQKIAIAPLFGQPSLVTLEKRKLIKTTALKLTNQLTSFNVLQSHHLALVGADDGTIKVLQ